MVSMSLLCFCLVRGLGGGVSRRCLFPCVYKPLFIRCVPQLPREILSLTNFFSVLQLDVQIFTNDLRVFYI